MCLQFLRASSEIVHMDIVISVPHAERKKGLGKPHIYFLEYVAYLIVMPIVTDISVREASGFSGSLPVCHWAAS